MKHTFSVFRSHYIFIITLIVISAMQLVHLLLVTRNVPFMDAWTAISEMGEGIMNGHLSFNDMWPSSGHKAPLSYLVFFISMRWLHYDVRILIYGGFIVNVLSSILLYRIFCRHFTNDVSKKVRIWIVPIILCVFNFNQWEILDIDASFMFMLRIFLYLYTFNQIDKYLHSLPASNRKTIIISLSLILIILLVSQAYFVAFVSAVSCIICFHYIVNYKYDKMKYVKCYLFLLVSMAIGSMIYLSEGMNNAGGEFSNNLISLDFIKGALIFLGSSINNLQFGGEIYRHQYYMFGFALAIVYVLAIIFYLKNKMYAITYFPLMLILYTIFNYILIYYSRSSYGIDYMASSRYTCESTLGIIGVLWIMVLFYQSKNSVGARMVGKVSRRIIPILSAAMIIYGLTLSIVAEFKIAPYRGEYFDTLQVMMKDLDSYTDEELSIFQANSPTYVRKGTMLLEKYHLSIFFHDDTNN